MRLLSPADCCRRFLYGTVGRPAVRSLGIHTKTVAVFAEGWLWGGSAAHRGDGRLMLLPHGKAPCLPYCCAASPSSFMLWWLWLTPWWVGVVFSRGIS